MNLVALILTFVEFYFCQYNQSTLCKVEEELHNNINNNRNNEMINIESPLNISAAVFYSTSDKH